MSKIRLILLLCCLLNGLFGWGQAGGSRHEKEIQRGKTSLFPVGICHVVMYGQSLMLGTNSVPVLSTTQPSNALMFSGGVRSGYDGDSAHFYDRLVPLTEKVVQSKYTGAKLGETPASGFAGMMMALWIKENKISFHNPSKSHQNHHFSLLLSSPAQGSTDVKTLTTPGIYWDRFKRDVLSGYRLATAAGKTYNVPCILWNQGERDIDLKTSPIQYKAYLKAFQQTADKFVKSVTHQKNTVRIILYQTVSQNVRRSKGNPSIANAQYELAKEEPYITMSNTTYQLPYGKDHVHFTNVGSKLNGADHGVACMRILADHQDWRPIYVKEITSSDSLIRVIFHVPVPPLVLDTLTVRNPGNYGFRLFDRQDREIGVKQVKLVGAQGVEIVANQRIPPGAYLWYGNNGTTTGPIDGARGNLRDSQGDRISINIQGKEMRIDNWTPILKEKL